MGGAPKSNKEPARPQLGRSMFRLYFMPKTLHSIVSTPWCRRNLAVDSTTGPPVKRVVCTARFPNNFWCSCVPAGGSAVGLFEGGSSGVRDGRCCSAGVRGCPWAWQLCAAALTSGGSCEPVVAGFRLGGKLRSRTYMCNMIIRSSLSCRVVFYSSRPPLLYETLSISVRVPESGTHRPSQPTMFIRTLSYSTLQHWTTLSFT